MQEALDQQELHRHLKHLQIVKGQESLVDLNEQLKSKQGQLLLTMLKLLCKINKKSSQNADRNTNSSAPGPAQSTQMIQMPMNSQAPIP